MSEAMGDHEHYCASYAAKDQPHIDELLMTLTDSLRSKERDIAAAQEAGENINDPGIFFIVSCPAPTGECSRVSRIC